jgi:hypothetical protein
MDAKTLKILFASTVLLLIVVGCNNGTSGAAQLDINDDFGEGNDGWESGFADLPADHDVDFFQLDSGRQELPDGLDGFGMYLRGDNHSDDLFMFLTKHITGLRPNTPYQVAYNIDLATNVPAGMMGIGGSPGESVYVKAGASTIQPQVEEQADGALRINIDKGNQATDGGDMITLGNLASEQTDGTQYVIESFSVQDFEGFSDARGNLWLIVGIDSGFEGVSTVYLARIGVSLTIK